MCGNICAIEQQHVHNCAAIVTLSRHVLCGYVLLGCVVKLCYLFVELRHVDCSDLPCVLLCFDIYNIVLWCVYCWAFTYALLCCHVRFCAALYTVVLQNVHYCAVTVRCWNMWLSMPYAWLSHWVIEHWVCCCLDISVVDSWHCLAVSFVLLC